MASKEDILNKIIAVLEENNHLTITEISSKIGSNWKTTNDNLEILRKLKLVNIYNEGKKTLASLKTNNTFFNLPLTKEQEDDANTLFYHINKKVIERHKETKAVACQKIAVEVIKKLDFLHIPVGWYQYGGISIFSNVISSHIPQEYDNNKEKAIINTIDDVMKTTFDGTEYCNGYIRRQYEKNENNIYLSKLELEKIFKETNMSYNHLLRQFLNLLAGMNKHDYLNQIKSEFNETLIEMLLSTQFETKIEKIFPYLEMAFLDFWNYFAIINFKSTLLENKEIAFSKEELDSTFNEEILNRKMTFEHSFERLENKFAEQ